MSDWRTTSLGAVVTLQRGFDLPTRFRRRGTVPIVSSSGVSGWHDRAMVKAPGVVTGRYGTIGEVFFEAVDFWPLNTTLWVSNFHGNDKRYIYYLLQRVNFAAHSGKSGVPGVNRNDLHKETVSLPGSIAEQRAIASALGDFDDLISTLERLIAKKQAIKQGMMQQLLTGRTRLPGFSGTWGSTQLGDHFEITSSKRVFQREWRSSGVPFYRARELAVLGETGSVNNELFIDRELYDKYKRIYGAPVPGDFLVTAVGTLGKTYVVQEGDEFYFKDGNIIWFRRSSTLDSDFLKFLFETPFVQDQVQGESSGTTVGTYTITNANKTQIPLVPLDEQRAIASALRSIERELWTLNRRLTKARDIKQGMMQELLTGRTRLAVEAAS